MAVLSLFTGAGGLDWGFHQAGFEVLSAIDIKPDAAYTYAQNFPLEVRFAPVLTKGAYSVGDILKSRAGYEMEGRFALLVGGPPCQDFSVLRGVEEERQGAGTLRGKLYLHYARYLALAKPLAFVFENVPGLLSSRGGEDLRTVLEDLARLDQLPRRWREQRRLDPERTPPPPEDLEREEGKIPRYRVVYRRVVDSSWHGVPQARKRLILIGFREDVPVGREGVLFLEEALSGSPALRKYPLSAMEALEGKVITDLEGVYRELLLQYGEVFRGRGAVEDYLCLHGGSFGDPLFERALEEHALVLKKMGWWGVSLTEAPPETFPDRTHFRAKESEAVRRRMWAIPPGANHLAVAGTEHEVRGRGFSLVYRRLHPLRPAYTVVAHGGGGTWGYHYARHLSRLTNRERARLQGFPDGFAFRGKEREVRAQIGEAVPPLLSEAIARTIGSLLPKSLKV